MAGKSPLIISLGRYCVEPLAVTFSQTIFKCSRSNSYQKNAGNRRFSYQSSQNFKTEMEISLSTDRHVSRKIEVLEFNKVFPDIVRDLTETSRFSDVPEATKRFAKVLQYNMTGGKRSRGLAVVTSYRLLADEKDLIPENIRRSQIMGWCLEMLHTSLLMAQDALFGAQTRRGKQCWYLTASKHDPAARAQVASNDATLLKTGIYQIIQKNFKNCHFYVDAIELFHGVGHNALMGQVLDLETRADPTLKSFTMDRYQSIIKYKSSYHSFKMPVLLAMYMSGIRDPELHRQAKTILYEMGKFFQIQDDYLDCYGNPAMMGRDGRDIQDGKCTWLSVLAIQRATPEQKKLLRECYGSKDVKKVSAVKELYTALGIPGIYKMYEEQTYELLWTQIQQISQPLPHTLFLKFLEKAKNSNVLTMPLNNNEIAINN